MPAKNKTPSLLDQLLADKDKASELFCEMKDRGVSFSAINELQGGFCFISGKEACMYLADKYELFALGTGYPKEIVKKYIDNMSLLQSCRAVTKKGHVCGQENLMYDISIQQFLDALSTGDYSYYSCKIHKKSPPERYLLKHREDTFTTVKPKTGYIYFVREESRGHVKIGRTVNLANRLKTFNVKLPFKVELLASFKCKDYIRAERELHKFYSDMRRDGEWFLMGENNIATATSPQLLEQLGIEVIE